MRLRLILSFILVVVVTVTGVILAARQSAVNEVRSFMFRGGMAGVEGLVESLEGYYRANNSWEGVTSLLDTSGHGKGPGMMGGMMEQRMRLADADGVLVSDTSGASTASHLTAEQMKSAVELKVDGRTVGYLLAEGGMGFTSRDEVYLVQRLNNAALIGGMAAGAVSLIIGLLLAYRLLRPVRELTQAARNLGEGDLAQRVNESGSDELALLARTFNAMASSLQKAEETRRAMTADIAHELRNPLAVQRANLEAIQDGIYPLEAESLAPVLEQNMLLTRLVEDLHILSLAEAGGLELERLSTDIHALVVQIAERFRPQAALRGVALDVRQPQSESGRQPISVDPLRIEQVISNLLSNALRFTPEGGAVHISVLYESTGVQVQIHDGGPGVPAEALPHVFERFYRADRARSRSEGGSGLGLAIARQLAELHGGSLSVENHPAGGAVFSLWLPFDLVKL